MESIFFAFSLTLIAGLSTVVGSFIVFLYNKPNEKILASCLAFSAGVMIYISMVEIFSKGKDALALIYSNKLSILVANLCFFCGMIFIVMIDRYIKKPNNEDQFFKLGKYTAIAMAIHNFPEGLATFIAALYDPSLGLSVVFAIAMHNIPEGIAVAIPIYYSTKSKNKSILYCLFSGLAEPLGAMIGYFLFLQFVDDTVYGILFCFVAGIMVFISFDELIPTALSLADKKNIIWLIVLGMVVMALSLYFFA